MSSPRKRLGDSNDPRTAEQRGFIGSREFVPIPEPNEGNIVEVLKALKQRTEMAESSTTSKSNPVLIEDLEELGIIDVWENGHVQRLLEDNLRELIANMNKDFFFEVAAGRVNGMFSINASGHATNVTSALMTVGNYHATTGALQTYSADGVNDIDSISSSSGSDTHDITIIGLDADHNVVKQTVTLTGQTRKALNTPINRIQLTYHAQNSSTGTVGQIFVYVDTTLSGGIPVDTTKIRSYIPLTGTTSNEADSMSVKTIPAGYYGMIVFGKVTVTDAKALELHFWGRPYGGVFKQSHHIDLLNNNYDYFFKVPQLIPPRTDLEVRANHSSGGAAEVSIHYDIVLIEESYIGNSLNPVFTP